MTVNQVLLSGLLQVHVAFIICILELSRVANHQGYDSVSGIIHNVLLVYSIDTTIQLKTISQNGKTCNILCIYSPHFDD